MGRKREAYPCEPRPTTKKKCVSAPLLLPPFPSPLLRCNTQLLRNDNQLYLDRCASVTNLPNSGSTIPSSSATYLPNNRHMTLSSSVTHPAPVSHTYVAHPAMRTLHTPPCVSYTLVMRTLHIRCAYLTYSLCVPQARVTHPVTPPATRPPYTLYRSIYRSCTMRSMFVTRTSVIDPLSSNYSLSMEYCMYPSNVSCSYGMEYARDTSDRVSVTCQLVSCASLVR